MNDAGETIRAPLAGKTIVVTRQKEQSRELNDFLERNGAEVILYPAVEFVEPPQWNECDAALDRLNEYSGIFFTSINAVHSFFRRAEARGRKEALRRSPLFPVGERTKQAIETHGFVAENVPERYSAADLASVVVRDSVRGKRFLFPKGNLAKSDLEEILIPHGASVDAVTVYCTQEPEFTAERREMMKEIEKRGDLLTFFSPSSVTHFIRRASANVIARETAVIGATTAEAARRAGLNVVVIAPQSTSAQFAEAIVQFYSSEQRK